MTPVLNYQRMAFSHHGSVLSHYHLTVFYMSLFFHYYITQDGHNVNAIVPESTWNVYIVLQWLGLDFDITDAPPCMFSVFLGPRPHRRPTPLRTLRSQVR